MPQTGTIGSGTRWIRMVRSFPSQTWGTAAWDLPLRCFDREGELWSVGTTYSLARVIPNGRTHWMDDGWVIRCVDLLGRMKRRL